MKKTHEAKILATVSAGLAALAIGSAQAANPFAATDLVQGYTVAQADDKAKDGKCGEGKCGEKKDAKAKDGKCGEKKDAKAKDGKCGEGKCGEGKCGAKK